MSDGLFGHAPGRGDRGQPGGNEAVHFTVETDFFKHRRAKGLEAAAQVLKLQAADAAYQCIGQFGRYFAQPKPVLPVLPPTGHQVQRFRQQPVDQALNIARVVLQITVHGDDDVAARRINAGLHRCSLLEVAQQPDRADVRPYGRRTRL